MLETNHSENKYTIMIDMKDNRQFWKAEEWADKA
jgi:hypothetical protein